MDHKKKKVNSNTNIQQNKRIQSVDNKKHIEIVLLSDADPIIEAGIMAQKEFAKNILTGLTEEERHICITDII